MIKLKQSHTHIKKALLASESVQSMITRLKTWLQDIYFRDFEMFIKFFLFMNSNANLSANLRSLTWKSVSKEWGRVSSRGPLHVWCCSKRPRATRGLRSRKTRNSRHQTSITAGGSRCTSNLGSQLMFRQEQSSKNSSQSELLMLLAGRGSPKRWNCSSDAKRRKCSAILQRGCWMSVSTLSVLVESLRPLSSSSS